MKEFQEHFERFFAKQGAKFDADGRLSLQTGAPGVCLNVVMVNEYNLTISLTRSDVKIKTAIFTTCFRRIFAIDVQGRNGGELNLYGVSENNLMTRLTISLDGHIQIS